MKGLRTYKHTKEKNNEFKKKCKCGHRRKSHLGDKYDGECCIMYRDNKTQNLKMCYCWKFEDAHKGENDE